MGARQSISQYSPLVLFFALFLMPIDWFSGTGFLFREAGAKPMNLFAAGWLLLLFIMGRNIWAMRVNIKAPYQLFIAGIVVSGGFAFLVGTINTPPLLTSDRSRSAQFFSQTAMLLLFMAVLQSQIYLFQSEKARSKVLIFLPWAASLHLFFFLAEAGGIFRPDAPGILAWFRNENGLIERASGLMSEPSYFGTFAALYSMPLLLFGGKYPLFNRLLALVILSCAFLVQSKSMYMVLGAQLAYLMFANQKSRNHRWVIWLALAAVVITGIYINAATQVLNLEENLSSIMRIGSNALALRVAADGYGVLGVGTGQFHFFYIPQFAPDFLFLSQEGLDQMYGVSGGRASTFNLPLRLLVETGLSGLLMAAWLVISLFVSQRRSTDTATQVGLCFVAGSLGFSMTQDSYCFPSLAFGMALAMTGPKSLSSTLTCRTI